MKVTLLNQPNLDLVDIGVGMCWGKGPYGTDTAKGIERIDRVCNQYKHGSILEHTTYTFQIEGVSRALLQELARHRMQALSVESTRYTTKGKLRNEEPFLQYTCVTSGEYELTTEDALERAAKYIHFTGNPQVDTASLAALDNVRDLVEQNIPNDVLKYALPESWLVQLVSTMNARALQHFLSLRSSKAALLEIRQLAQAMYDVIPDSHKFLFTHCMATDNAEHV